MVLPGTEASPGAVTFRVPGVALAPAVALSAGEASLVAAADVVKRRLNEFTPQIRREKNLKAFRQKK